MRNLKAQDNDDWHIVQDGVPEIHPLNNVDDEQKRLMLLDKQDFVFITNHLDEAHYHMVQNIESSKDVQDYIQNISEGANAQKDARVDTLQRKFHRFKRKEGENLLATFHRLVCLSAELTTLGAKDIKDNMVVRTLLRSLASSYDNIRCMIKERADFASLKHVDIIEWLKTFEMEENEHREVNGTKRSHALKAKALHGSSSESDHDSGCDSNDPSGIEKDLALVMRRFNRFQKKWSPKKNSSRSSSHSSSRSHSSSKDNACYK